MAENRVGVQIYLSGSRADDRPFWNASTVCLQRRIARGLGYIAFYKLYAYEISQGLAPTPPDDSCACLASLHDGDGQAKLNGTVNAYAQAGLRFIFDHPGERNGTPRGILEFKGYPREIITSGMSSIFQLPPSNHLD